MKKLLLVIFTLLFSTVNSYCLLLDAIIGGVNFIRGEVNKISDEVFKINMLKQTIENVSTLKKNYEDSVKFYNDIKRIQQDPLGISKQLKDQFISGLDNPVDRFLWEVDQRSYDKKSFVQKKLDSGLEYVQQNWNFGDRVIEAMKKRDEKAKKTIEALSSEKKEEVESGKIQMELLQYEQFGAIERGILKLIEIQNKQLERQIWYEEFARDLQNKYYTFAQELRKIKQKQPISREEKIKQYIQETPKYEIPRK